MPSKLRTALGISAATAIAAAGLAALPTEASAGVGCTTVLNDTPVHSEPSPNAPISSRVALAGTVLGCSGGPDWFHVEQNGTWIGFVHATYVDTSAG
jgi:hypothetical protein